MTLPTFITVGAEKCGTTALHTHLSKHPEIFMSEPKEPSYFVSNDERYTSQDMGGIEHPYVRDLMEYEKIFSQVTDERAIGESSPCYLYSDIAAKAIYETIPHAKVIIILRNPMRRAFSQYVFNQMRGWESRQISFEQALEMEDKRRENNSMWAFHYIARGLYYEQVKRYLDVFGMDAVKVVLYEDFATNPQKSLDDICQFLGVSEFRIPDINEKHNVSKLVKNKSLDDMMRSNNLLNKYLKNLIPATLKEKIKNKIYQMNSTKPTVDEDVIKQLERRFADDIKALDKIVSPDTQSWLSSQ